MKMNENIENIYKVYLYNIRYAARTIYYIFIQHNVSIRAAQRIYTCSTTYLYVQHNVSICAAQRIYTI